MRNLIAPGTLLFLVVAIATLFVIPSQPCRMLKASRESNRMFVRILPGGRWALTARLKKEEDDSGNINFKHLAPMRLYDLQYGKETQDLISSGEMWSTSLAKLSPDGKLLAISIRDNSFSSPLYLWDLESLKLLATLPRNTSTITEQDRDICCFSPDGRFVAYLSATYQNEIAENGYRKISEKWHLRLWNKDKGSEVEIDPVSRMSLVTFSPDSKQIAVGLSIYSTSDGSMQSTLKLQAPWASPVVSQWTPNGKNLALLAPTYDHQKPTRIDVTFWNPSTSETRQMVLTPDHNLRLDSANFSHDGRYLFLKSSSWSSEIWALDIDPPTRIGYSRAEDFSPTAEKPFAVVGENPVRARLWKLDTPLEKAPVMLESELVYYSTHFNSDHSLTSISNWNSEFKVLDLWDTSSLKRISRFSLTGGFAGFSNTGKTFFEAPPPGATSALNEWDVSPAPPWKWLIPVWFVEAALLGWGIVCLMCPSKQPTGDVAQKVEIIQTNPQSWGFVMAAGQQSFNAMKMGLGMTGASLWILSMLGPSFALQHPFPLSVQAHDSQVVCFLALFIATMYALALHRANAQFILGVLFLILYLWLKSVLKLTAMGNVAMVSGALLIAASAVLRQSSPVSQERVDWKGAKIPITIFIGGSLITAMCALLPSSILGKTYKVPSAPVASIVLLSLIVIGSFLVLIRLNSNGLRSLRLRSTASRSDESSDSPTTSLLGIGLILAGISGLVFFALLRSFFPILTVESSPFGSKFVPTYEVSNLLDSVKYPYYTEAFVALLGLSILLFVTRKLYLALASVSTMLALTILVFSFLLAEAEQIRDSGFLNDYHDLLSDYSLVWESWLALMMGNWLMILSCFLSIQHFRRERFLRLHEIQERNT
jgi:drug/metabolite transporter superfamily protein YnfA